MPFTPQTSHSLTQTVYPASRQIGTTFAWPAGATAVQALGLLDDTSLQNASLNCKIFLWVSTDNGQTWNQDGTNGWVGNTADPHNPGQFIQPNVKTSYATSGNPPTNVAVGIDVGSSMSIGGDLIFS